VVNRKIKRTDNIFKKRVRRWKQEILKKNLKTPN
jgi:hypothetical protein